MLYIQGWNNSNISFFRINEPSRIYLKHILESLRLQLHNYFIMIQHALVIPMSLVIVTLLKFSCC